jgi:TP901 family phage tail tape measure protein
MPSKTVVSTIFAAKDKVSVAFKKMAGNAKKFEKVSVKSLMKASKAAEKFKSVTGGILKAAVIAKGAMLAKQAIAGLTEEIITFDQALITAAAKFGNIDRSTKEGAASFAALEKAARDAGATTQFTATQAGQALESMAMAGFTDQQAIASLTGVINLATASSIELEEATSIAADALGAFNLKAQDSATLSKNLTRINDVFAKTITSSNIVMEDMFEAMKSGAPVATAAGASIETFNAMVGVLGNAGIKGSLAGTSLKNVFLKLSAPAEGAAKVLKKLGIVTTDAAGNLRDPIQLIEELRVATKGMGTAQKAAALDVIFGKRAIASATVLMQAGGTELNKFRTMLEGAGGASAKMADQIRESLNNRLKTLKSALIEVGLKVFDVFKSKFPGALDKATEAIRNMDVEPIINGLKTLVSVGKKLISWGDAFIPIMAGVVAGLVAFKIITAAIALQTFISGLVALTVAAGGSATVMGVLNAVMMANPVIVIAAGIAILIAGIVALVKNWDKVKAAFKKAFDFIKAKLQQAWNWFSNMLDNPFFTALSLVIAPWLTIPALIVKHWDKIKIFFLGMWGFIKDSFWVAFDFIRGKLLEAWNWFSGMLDNPFFTTIATVIAPWLTIPALIVKHWETIKTFFIDMWNGIVGVYDEAVILVEGAFTSMGDAAKTVVNFIAEQFNWLKEKLAPIIDPISKFIDKAKGIGAKILGGGAGAGKGMVAEIMARGEKELGRTAPNNVEAPARAEAGSFAGKLMIEGAPPGSKLEQKSRGTPRITAELGAN